VIDRLKLDPSTEQVSDLGQADTAVIQDSLVAGPRLEALRSRVKQGMGLLLILGSHTDPAAVQTLTDGAVRQTGVVEVPGGPQRAQQLEEKAAIIRYVGPAKDRLASAIGWGSATRIKERSVIACAQGDGLVAVKPTDKLTPNAPILLRLHKGKGTIYILTAWIKQGDQSQRIKSYAAMLRGDPDAENYDLQRWAYFNWLLYYLSRDAGGTSPVPFGSWIAAPVPNHHDVKVLSEIFGTVFLLLLAAFIASRRYSIRHPEKLDQFYRPVAADATAPMSLGAAAAAQPISEKKEASRGDPRWETVGFHRPLSGFFYNFILSLVIMIPLNFLVTFYIERNFVNPFLEARGAWAAVTLFMGFFFVLLDVGTSQAMVKYFAEYRLTEPSRAVKYAQFFIWFHAMAGIFQITTLGLFAAIYLPQSGAAYLAWLVVLHTLIQFPGFIAIFFNLFRALQRFDYSQFIIVLAYVLTPVVQMVCGVFMRRWGLMHPVFGEGLGVVIGFALGGFLSNLLMGIFCALFYRAVGFKLTTIFLAHFDRDTVTRSLKYGLKLTLGQALAALSWGVIVVEMLLTLDDFLELNEIFIVTITLTFGYLETGAYIFTTLMPTISESFSHGKIALTRRYLDQGLRWAMVITLMLAAAYVAFSDVFIRGLLPAQFARAAEVIVLMHIWRAVDFTTRMPDQVFQGVGRTGLFTVPAVVENVSRMILAWIFLNKFGFVGLFYAFIISSALKSLVSWPLMMGFVIAPAISTWQTLINPLITAVCSYAILRTTALILWQGPGHTLSSAITVMVLLLGALPLYMLITGLLGWDEKSLIEFNDAADLVPAPFGRIAEFARCMLETGAALSPLQNRFPGRLTQQAFEEAAVLTSLKTEMH
jgi:O-antigen/teichoic acid export membrane protein